MRILAVISILIMSNTALALRGGKYFKAEQFPEVVGSYQSMWVATCTSTKIAPKMYITAAHCIKVLDLTEKMERRIQFRKSTKEVRSNIDKIFFHPTVDLSSFSDGKHPSLKIGNVIGHMFGKKIIDVAIYTIKDEFPEIESMPLFTGELKKHQVISMAAYGDTGNGYPLYPRWGLQKIKKVSKTFIKVKHSKEYPAEIMSGDSGLPLIVTIDEQRFLAGIAAWKKPGIFGGAGYFIAPENFVEWAMTVIDNQVEANLIF